jgi:hypothetical protein
LNLLVSRKWFWPAILTALFLFGWSPALAQNCSSAFPHGVSGSVRVRPFVTLHPQGGLQYTAPLSAVEQLTNTFTAAVDEDAAANPNGPQFTWIGPYENGWNIIDSINIYVSGGTSDSVDQAWVENAVQGMGQPGWLFNETGAAFTANSSGGIPQQAAMADAGHRFYRFIAYGWHC